MDLLLPDGLKALIRDRYLAGVSDAQAKYRFHAADEDTLTGALGNCISMPHEMTFSDGRGRYSYQVSYRKIRGRGPRAPEKRLGADGIFQIEVTDERGRQTKGLTPDERRDRVADMAPADEEKQVQRILVATDCLSEGINLQHLFDTVVHYDLSWNPTRHQQREGRVDRFGQAPNESQ